MNVKIKVPQDTTLSAPELAEADIQDTTLTLPAGMTASGGAANGLDSCTAGQLGFTRPGEDLELQLEERPLHAATRRPARTRRRSARSGSTRRCSNSELTGSVYLARVDTQPFSSPLVLYIIAEEPESGVRVKLAGEVDIDPDTGQLTSIFDEHAAAAVLRTRTAPVRRRRAPAVDARTTAAPTRRSASFLASSSTTAHPVTVTSGPELRDHLGPERRPLPRRDAAVLAPGFKAGVAEHARRRVHARSS